LSVIFRLNSSCDPIWKTTSSTWAFMRRFGERQSKRVLIFRPCSTRRRSPGSAMEGWAGRRRATWIPSQPLKCLAWATVYATSSVFSTRRSEMAGRWNEPTSGSDWATPGRWLDQRSPIRSASGDTPRRFMVLSTPGSPRGELLPFRSWRHAGMKDGNRFRASSEMPEQNLEDAFCAEGLSSVGRKEVRANRSHDDVADGECRDAMKQGFGYLGSVFQASLTKPKFFL
jgi:hypothetical protein